MSAVTDTDETGIPTLHAWIGGSERIEALMTAFYAKVHTDSLLAPVFAQAAAEHPAHVARFLTEVFGGPKAYSESGGSHRHMIMRHLGRHLNDEMRKHWIALLLRTADELEVPADPEFRSALVGYLEWGTRIAVLNSQPGVAPPSADLPMPEWNWGPPGGPYRG